MFKRAMHLKQFGLGVTPGTLDVDFAHILHENRIGSLYARTKTLSKYVFVVPTFDDGAIDLGQSQENRSDHDVMLRFRRPEWSESSADS